MTAVLVDTNVWIRHFKSSDKTLYELLNAGRIVTHEFIIEELLLGGLTDREQHIHLLCLLERYQKVSHSEISEFIKQNVRPRRFKVGLIDSYLLCTALLHDLAIYSDDTGVTKAAHALGINL